MKQINIEQVVRIHALKETESKEWSFQEERKLLGFTIQQRGYVHYFDRISRIEPRNEVPVNCIDINGTVFVKPRLKVVMSNGEVLKHFFDTYEDAVEFAIKAFISQGEYITFNHA